MRTHLRYSIDRKLGEVVSGRFELVVRREALGHQPRDERVDDRVALFRRHIGLDGEGAMLAVDNRVADQTVQIGGEHMIDAECEIEGQAVHIPDLGTALDAPDGLPECRGIGPPTLQAIEQDMLDLVHGREGAAILRQHRPFG